MAMYVRANIAISAFHDAIDLVLAQGMRGDDSGDVLP
jgi:hypothetical protein